MNHERHNKNKSIPKGKFIPVILENQNYVLGSNILKGCLAYRQGKYAFSGRHRLFVRLTRSIGLSPKVASIWEKSRTLPEAKRLDETIQGILDSLLLFDTELFLRDSPGPRVVNNIVRSIWSVGCYSLASVVSQWKTIGNYILHKAARTKLLEPLEEIPPTNIFKILLGWKKVQRILSAESIDKRDLEGLAHLLSSRQLPAGDKLISKKAILTFKENLQRDYVPAEGIIQNLYEACYLIGKRTRKASSKTDLNSHISLAISGSLFKTVKEGGRARELLEAIKPILTHIPEEDEEVHTPLGPAKCPKGIPRWRSWGRPDVLPDTGKAFGEKLLDTLGGREVFSSGMDVAIGFQIVACSYLEYLDWGDPEGNPYPIMCRVLTVPEPGHKARIVTTGPYWTNVLQQPIGHLTRALLASHPSAAAGLRRQDQAWQFLYMASKAHSYPKDTVCLSSDLSEATDNIPHEVAKAALAGFKAGYGYHSELYDIACELVTRTHLMCFPDGSDILTRRGVLMGEPLTKTVLTLVNLASEEIAIRQYLKIGFRIPVRVPWRCFAVAGDDHVALGPADYCDLITAAHIAFGEKISTQKHGTSSRYVKMCEKLLEVAKLTKKFDVRKINDSTKTYEDSPFIDSIKVRLLSPTSKAIEVVNDRNIAIGKGLSLGRTLRWLNRDHFSPLWVKMIRDRFFQRMGGLLPDSSSGVFWHILLPTQYGGMDLWVDEDIPLLTHKLPEPTKCFIKEVITTGITSSNYPQSKLFSGFLSNSSYRGFKLSEDSIGAFTELLREGLLPEIPKLSWKDAVSKIPNNEEKSAGEIASLLKSRGFLRIDELKDRSKRPFLFKEILEGRALQQSYNTKPLKKRYADLWDLVYSGDEILTEDDIRKALKTRWAGELYDLGATRNPLPQIGQMPAGTYDIVEESTWGMPSLTLGWKTLGNVKRPLELETLENTIVTIGDHSNPGLIEEYSSEGRIIRRRKVDFSTGEVTFEGDWTLRIQKPLPSFSSISEEFVPQIIDEKPVKHPCPEDMDAVQSKRRRVSQRNPYPPEDWRSRALPLFIDHSESDHSD